LRLYFVTGNFWLALGFLAWVGRQTERYEPTMYSFMGIGRWFAANEYAFVVAVPLILAAGCFLLFALSHQRKSS